MSLKQFKNNVVNKSKPNRFFALLNQECKTQLFKGDDLSIYIIY